MVIQHSITDSFGNKVRKDAYVIRATELGQFINCPRNWMFMSHNGFNLEPNVRPNKLRFGIVWHAGMEALYRGDDPVKALRDEMDKEVELVMGVAAFDPTIREEIDNERALADTLMQGYLVWRNNEADPPDTSFTPKWVERRILLPIDGSRAYLAARLDAEVLDKNGGLWVLEHKTRGKSSSVINPPELQLDLQMGLQLYASERSCEYKTRGVLYNLTRKQMPGPRVKSPIYGRHAVTRSKAELAVMEYVLTNMYYDMRNASTMIRKDPEKAMLTLRYNPQPMGLCAWGCSVKDICEAINRREDVQYLIDAKLKPRDKTIWETLRDELDEN